MQKQENYLCTLLSEHFGNFPYILFSVPFITTSVFNNFREHINGKLENRSASDSKSLDLLKSGRRDLYINFFFFSQDIHENIIFIKSFHADRKLKLFLLQEKHGKYFCRISSSYSYTPWIHLVLDLKIKTHITPFPVSCHFLAPYNSWT